MTSSPDRFDLLSCARFLRSHSRTPLRFLRVIAAAAAVWLSAAPAAGIVWVARHAMSGDDYQNEFDKWTGEGLRLQCVSGYTDNGQLRFAAVWDNRPGSAPAAAHGLTASGFDTANADQVAAGRRATFINMYEFGGQLYYAAMWHAGTAPTTRRLGRTWAQFQSDHAQLSGDGWRLRSVSCASVNGTDYYAGLWYQPPGLVYLQQHGFRMTSQEYQSAFNQWTAQGYRQAMVCACQVGNDVRYCAIWRKPFGDPWWAYSSLSGANYQTETWNAVYQGCRTEFVSAYTFNGQARFNGQWAANGGMGFDCLGLIDAGIRAYMDQTDTTGVTLGIMVDGRLVFARGWGHADAENDEWAGPLHRYRIASISKPVTAAAILELVEANQFDLDDTVFGNGALFGTQFGNGSYSTWERQITVRHLLTHTTGWTSDGPMWDNSYGANHNAIMDWTLDSNNPSSQPGSMYQYMNLDYHALGRLIEQESGQSYENYCRSVLAQCGITGMEIGNQTKAGRLPMEVVYYAPDGGDPYSDIHPARMDANGGWIGTVIELLQFLRRVDDAPTPPDVLTQVSRDEMRTGTTANMTYGLGWFWDGSTYEGHNGCMTGTSSFLINRPNGVAYAVLANKRTNCSWELKAAVDGIISQLEAKNEWPSYNLFPPNSGFNRYLIANFPRLGSVIGSLHDWTDADADPDGDGMSNRLEAYFNTDPRRPDPPPEFSVAVRDGGAHVRWRRAALDYGFDVFPQVSNDLRSWAADRAVVIGDLGIRPPDTSHHTYEAVLPMQGRRARFLRLEPGEK